MATASPTGQSSLTCSLETPRSVGGVGGDPVAPTPSFSIRRVLMS